jgi:transcriptional regulator with XRE-family HTH domain
MSGTSEKRLRRTHDAPALGRLVRVARGLAGQRVFAASLGVSQETLSRYERGNVEPPAHVISKCWEIVEAKARLAAPQIDELALRLQTVSGPEFIAVREAIARIIEMSGGKGLPGRPPKDRRKD